MPRKDNQGMETEAVRREWLSYAEASEFSGLGRTTLWTLASTGQVQAAKVGTAVRFSRTSLQAFMERNNYAKRR
jgi:excisionase family DNA binding protein